MVQNAELKITKKERDYIMSLKIEDVIKSIDEKLKNGMYPNVVNNKVLTTEMTKEDYEVHGGAPSTLGIKNVFLPTQKHKRLNF